MKIGQLRLCPLPQKSRDKLALNMVKGFNNVKSDAVRKMGKLATMFHLPLMILALRHAADNLFVRLFKFLSKDTDRFMDPNTESLFGEAGAGLWCQIHDEITRIFDPHKYLSFLPSTGNLDQKSVMEKNAKRDARSKNRAAEDFNGGDNDDENDDGEDNGDDDVEDGNDDNAHNDGYR